MANNNSGKNEKDLVCSFCGKHQDEVERMIIGPGVNICSECIGLCHDLLSDQPEHPEANGRPGRGASRTRMQAVDGLDINILTRLRSRTGWTSMSLVRMRPSVCWRSPFTTIISAS